MTGPSLHALFAAAAAARPDHVAVELPPAAQASYAELDVLSDTVRDRLLALGVRRGDRVGLCVAKSIDAVAALLGALKAGAAYVPVDPAAPAWRAALVLTDCAVRVLVIAAERVAAFCAEVRKLGVPLPELIVVAAAGDGSALRRALGEPPPGRADEVGPDDLAYILYTSGSTGKPKGVMLSHGNALAFVEWLAQTFDTRASDRFSAHAPFHFDLSILDLYLCFRRGATLVLIETELGREPHGLARLIAERRISVWYSAPTILSLLAQYGKLGEHDFGALRIVFFAGEVFPVRHLRQLTTLWSGPRYFNLYGPTETNVCTWYEIPSRVPHERTAPFPIGRLCAPLAGRLVGADGRDVEDGEGELVISGPTVMQGYWNLPEQTARAFLVDVGGTRWYRTGDIATRDANGDYSFVGRRDRMVKRRGHRVELGDVEAGLYRHPDIREAAVTAVPDGEGGVRIRAFVALAPGAARSVVAMKKFAAEQLAASLIPDEFVFVDALPKTSTDKIDYQRLAAGA